MALILDTGGLQAGEWARCKQGFAPLGHQNLRPYLLVRGILLRRRRDPAEHHLAAVVLEVGLHRQRHPQLLREERLRAGHARVVTTVSDAHSVAELSVPVAVPGCTSGAELSGSRDLRSLCCKRLCVRTKAGCI